MIIQCEACLARFKLDPSRIKGKGARIRCRKCGEAIIVMKSDFSPPEKTSPVKKDLFDLGSILREPEATAPVPIRDNPDTPIGRIPDRDQETAGASFLQGGGPEIPTEREQESLAQEVAEPAAEPADTARAELEAPIESPPLREEEAGHEPSLPEEEPLPPPEEKEAPDLRSVFYQPEEITEEPSHDGIEPPVESPPLREEEAGQEPSLPEEPPPLPDFPDDPISLDLGKEKELPFLRIPAQGVQEDAGEEKVSFSPPSEEKRAPGEEPEEFLRLDTALPDFLRKMGPTADPGKPFDISGRLRPSPPETSEEDTEPVPPVPDQPPEIEESPLSRADTIQEELAGLAEATSVEDTPAVDAHVEEPPPPDIPPPMPMEIERKQVTRQLSRARSGKPSVALLLLLFTLLAGGGAYLAFTETGQESLRTIVPSLESFWLGGKETVPPYHVGNLIGYYENGNAGKMFIIKGVVTNQARTPKSGIRIHAELLDVNQQTIAEKTAYAGNIITELRSAARQRIEAAMSNHLGDKLSNVDIGPGKSVPFMVVFFDSPEGIEEYRLEARDAE